MKQFFATITALGIILGTFGACLLSPSESAAWVATRMRKAKPSLPMLRFTTAAQTLATTWLCSGVVTVETADAGGTTQNVPSSLTVSLAGTLSEFYSDAGCTAKVTSVVVASGTSSKNFYFKNYSAGNPVITAAAATYQNATQTETITSRVAFTWIGGSSSAWGTAANWSGNAVPGSGDSIYFDGGCSPNCSPTLPGSAISVAAVNIHSSYTGTIAQNGANAITATAWNQNGGTFTGSSGTITINGAVVLSAGTFTSTSGTMVVSGDWAVTGTPTFNANSGTMNFTGSSVTFTVGSENYNNVTLGLPPGTTSILSGNMNVNGNFLSSQGNCCNSVTLSGGTIKAAGNVTTASWGGITFNLELVGSGNQTVSNSSLNDSRFANFKVSSTGGTVTYVGSIWIYGTYTFVSGNLNAGTSTMYFTPQTGGTTITVGSEVYNNVWLQMPTNATTTLSGSMNVGGTLSGNGSCCGIGVLNGGAILVSGDLAQAQWNYHVPPGTTNYTMVGSTNANISVPQGDFDSIGNVFTIAKTGGAKVTLVAPFSANSSGQRLTITSGTLDMGGNSLTVNNQLTISAGATLTRNGGTLTYGSLSNSGTLNP